MNDNLISRQAAIEALRTCYDTHTLYDENNGDDYILYNEAVGEIENLPSIQPKTAQWILCSTKLPDNKSEYLVTYHPCFWDLVEETVKVGLDTFRGKVWAKRKYQKVIAWMPLPEPCQAESEVE